MDRLTHCQAAILAENTLNEDGPRLETPVRIRTADGQVVNGVFHGYWDMRPLQPEPLAAVSRPLADGKMTTGMLRPGEEILDPIPSFEEWGGMTAS